MIPPSARAGYTLLGVLLVAASVGAEPGASGPAGEFQGAHDRFVITRVEEPWYRIEFQRDGKAVELVRPGGNGPVLTARWGPALRIEFSGDWQSATVRTADGAERQYRRLPARKLPVPDGG